MPDDFNFPYPHILKAERRLWGASPATPEARALCRALARDEVADRHAAKEKVQPRNLRGPVTEARVEELWRLHLFGEVYLGVVAMNKHNHIYWMQIDCDFPFETYLAEMGWSLDDFGAKLKAVCSKLGITCLVHYTRNNWAIDIHFASPISRKAQQAIYLVFIDAFDFDVPGQNKNRNRSAECLPDNPIRDHAGNLCMPKGKTPILAGHAIALPNATRKGRYICGANQDRCTVFDLSYFIPEFREA